MTPLPGVGLELRVDSLPGPGNPPNLVSPVLVFVRLFCWRRTIIFRRVNMMKIAGPHLKTKTYSAPSYHPGWIVEVPDLKTSLTLRGFGRPISSPAFPRLPFLAKPFGSPHLTFLGVFFPPPAKQVVPQ